MIGNQLTLAAAAIGHRSLRIAAGSIMMLMLSAQAPAQTPISNAAQIGAGTVMTCILTTAGGVKCWGNNVFSSLGNGSTLDSPGAADVVGLTSGVTAIAVGGYHACALTSAGAVKCWGSNDNGQLGNGTKSSQTSPITVNGLGAGVIAIAAGREHTCAVTAAGALKCWGGNYDGQLGDGTTTGRDVPTDVAGLGSAISAVAANYAHTCALTTAGGVKCWGANDEGQLGNGNTQEQHQPVAVSGLASGAGAIAVGGTHTCARMQGGGLKCWGANDNGQVGDGTTAGRLAPVDVIGLGGSVSAVAAGNAHTCAVLSGGSAKCWGSNRDGQLGDGTTTTHAAPVAVSGLSAGVTLVAAGDEHSCAVAAGAVKCWGANHDQQLGDGATRPRLTPVGVVGLASGMATVAAGGNHSCAVTAAGGARCWGMNSSGQLGDGSGVDHTTAVTPAGLASGVTAVATGYYFSCALTTAGGAKCWGSNSTSQLGVGAVNTSVPNDVVGLASGVTAISVGDNHSCALTSAGGVKCWGYNYAGALGDGTTTERPLPVDVTGLTSGVFAISAGSYHTCAVLTGGAVKCWGANESGQLGDGTGVNRTAPVSVSGLGQGVTAIAAGSDHTCALTAGGGVKCWGANGSGQIGDGSASLQLTPVDVQGLTSGVTAITAGASHNCAIAGGAARCWGGNREGELGDGTTMDQHVPVAVLGLDSGVTAIDGGVVHTCAVAAGGARCWGANAYGQMGDGIATIATTPVTALLALPAAVEFYNTPLDNFFITADPVEAAAIDNGSAGPGWARTGNRFPSGGGIAVCRFYGSQSPGPNSHFYTASATECAGLIALQASTPASVPRWNFESYDFLTNLPANGACPAQTVPVYRAYNNGFARHVDSNHRITNNLAAIQSVVARGWIYEGIVMCAPQ